MQHINLSATEVVKGIGSDFHDRSSVGYNRSMINHNRLRMLSC